MNCIISLLFALHIAHAAIDPLRITSAIGRAVTPATQDVLFNCGDPETESGWTYGAPGHLAAIRLGAVRKANKVSLEAARLARFAIEATIMLDDESALSNDDLSDLPDRAIESDSELFCPKSARDLDALQCRGGESAHRLRSIDGRCNNLFRPHDGAASTAFRRLLPPLYDNGISEPRQFSVAPVPTGSFAEELPSARLVSTTLSNDGPDRERPHPSATMTLVFWGQFVDHDITLTPEVAINGEPPRCCGLSCPHEDCFPITIPNDDPVIDTASEGPCHQFVRSLPAQTRPCRLGRRQQLNQQTSFHDSSQVYGAEEDLAMSIRELSGGRLMVSEAPSATRLRRSLLPPPEEDDNSCMASGGRHCFLAGDERVNEQPMLTALHTVMVREHNRLARALQTEVPDASDEELYQAARQIVGGLMQKITYHEYLPNVVGPELYTERLNQLEIVQADFLNLQRLSAPGGVYDAQGFYTGYDVTDTAAISNEFATASYRFGHTLLSNVLQKRRDDDLRATSPALLPLADLFFQADRILFDDDGIDGLVAGSAGQASQSYDEQLVEAVQDRLNQEPGLRVPAGLDLFALNLQRGRDHGLQAYTAYRRACSGETTTRFEDLRRIMSRGCIRKLRSVYSSVDDIDLFAGGVCERPLPNALVGPTFACHIVEQFRRGKTADRFWFERREQFTGPQLTQVRRRTLAQVLCDNTDVQRLPRWVMQQSSTVGNPEVDCRRLSAAPFDIAPFAELIMRQRLPSARSCAFNEMPLCHATGMRCLPISARCNRIVDCPDASDETHCPHIFSFQ